MLPKSVSKILSLARLIIQYSFNSLHNNGHIFSFLRLGNLSKRTIWLHAELQVILSSLPYSTSCRDLCYIPVDYGLHQNLWNEVAIQYIQGSHRQLKLYWHWGSAHIYLLNKKIPYAHAQRHMNTHMPSEYMGIRKSATLSPEVEEMKERHFCALHLFYPFFITWITLELFLLAFRKREKSSLLQGSYYC